MENNRIETIKEVIDVWNSNSSLLLENSVNFRELLFLALNEPKLEFSDEIDEDYASDEEDSDDLED
jgi:hypothetical protein